MTSTLLTLLASLALSLAEPPAAPPPTPAAAKDIPKGAHESDLPIPGVTNWTDATSANVETVINAPLRTVWEVFSTDDGFTKLGVAKAKIDFRVGGLMLSHYDSKGSLDGPGHIENQIIAFDPDRMISFRIHQPPQGFPFPNAWKTTWSVVTFTPEGPDRTRLRLSMLGFTPDEESQKMRDFFEKGNAWTLKHLKETLDSADAQRKSDRAWAILSGFVGNAWRGCADIVGGPNICATTVWSWGPNQKSITYLIKLGEGPTGAQRPHIQMVLTRDPATGAVAYTGVDDDGRATRGFASLADENAVALEWKHLGDDPAAPTPVVTYSSISPGQYAQRNYRSGADLAASKPWIDLTFKRAPGAPQSSLNSPGPVIDGSLFVGPSPAPAQPPIFREWLVQGKPEETYALWSSRTGLISWLSEDANVELRIGGPYEILFNMQAPEGERGGEGCQVLAFVPDRMLSFSWTAPPKFPEQRALRTWVTLQFSPAEPTAPPENIPQTRVSLTHTGFGEGPGWAEVHTYFNDAWNQVMWILQSHCEKLHSGPP